MTTISSRTNLPLTESTRKHQPSLSYREHASHSNSNHAFLLSRDKTDASERKDEQKIQREKQGKHGKENHRNKRTKKSTTGTSRRKEHKQKKTQRDQPARPRHRPRPFIFISSFFSSSGATFSSIGISRSSSPQENRERARKHRGKNIHSAGTSHLHHRLRRLQRKHRQEEKDRDQHQLPAFVVVFRISDDRLCARNCSTISFARFSAR